MLVVILIYSLIFLTIETPGLIKNKQWLDLGVGSGFLLLAIGYGLETIYTWHLLPNPNIILNKLMPLTDAFFVFFHLPVG
ncbi:MAG TPA: hypothetical protein P5273_00865 [Syntrophomonadaceae bacterium]|jgi:hypothetical protein|nr:hypothetical protein [Syntrophomonadaceae bacterium]